jgi:hypothetical protein
MVFLCLIVEACNNNLAKANCLIVAAVIPLKRDAIDELRLALASLKRFENIAKISGLAKSNSSKNFLCE